MALKYSDTLAANRAALGNYSWQLRVEVTKDGELEYVDLMKGRYDNVVLVQGTNVLREGDRVPLFIDKTSGTPVKLWFSSPDGTGANVVATVNFRHLRTDGIFVPDQADTVFRSGDNKGNLNIKIESFEFLKQL